MHTNVKSWSIKSVEKICRLIAGLPFFGVYSYKLAKMMVRCYDNDANSDFYSNGECRLLNYFIKKQLLKTVFDVGANIGGYTSLIAGSEPKDIKIYSFDPRESNIEYLKKRFHGRKDISVISAALSDNNGSIDFYQNSDPSQSGTDSVYDMTTIGYFPKSDKISVPCITIDNFSAENHIDHINLVKLDTEGHELFVLRGAKKMLSERNIDYIQFEYGHTTRAARIFLIDFVNFLKTYEYRIYVIDPKGIKPFTYSPWEENRFNMINFIAVSKTAPNDLKDIVIKKS